MNNRETRRNNAAIIEDSAAVFVNLQNGNYRCHKARTTGVIRGGLYSLRFVEAYASRVSDVIIAEETQI